jgi:hypothetical protein
MNDKLKALAQVAYEEWCRPRMSNVEPDHPQDAFVAGYFAALASDTGERGDAVAWLYRAGPQVEWQVASCQESAQEMADTYHRAHFLRAEAIPVYAYPPTAKLHPSEAALRAQPAGGGVELKLRRLLAMRVAGAMLYTDDGELSDGTEHPAIDFLRHSPEEIESLLRRRAELKAAIATPPPPSLTG